MVDLRRWPMVVETLPQALGMFDDRWWSTSGPIIKPQWPLIFDLIDDPG
jgi:hypothetical protein